MERTIQTNRFDVTVLHLHPVKSAQDAVGRAIIMHRGEEQHRRKLKSGDQSYLRAKRRAGSCPYASRQTI